MTPTSTDPILLKFDPSQNRDFAENHDFGEDLLSDWNYLESWFFLSEWALTETSLWPKFQLLNIIRSWDMHVHKMPKNANFVLYFAVLVNLLTVDSFELIFLEEVLEHMMYSQ